MSFKRLARVASLGVVGSSLVGGGSRSSQVAAPNAGAGMTQAMWRSSQQNLNQVQSELTNQVESSQLYQDARARSENALSRTEQQVERSLGRRLSQLTPAQRRAMQNRLTSTVAAGSAADMTQASMMDRDLGDQAATMGANTAATLGTMASGAMSQFDAMAAQRNAQNQAARRASRSGFGSMLGSIAGGIAGSFLGPGGAALGASIGGGLGGQIGG